MVKCGERGRCWMSSNGKVYVNGLPHSTTDEQLDGLCRQHGRVKSARVVSLFDKTIGQRRGFGLVEMESPDDNHKVIAALNKRKLDGSMLRCFAITSSKDVEGGC